MGSHAKARSTGRKTALGALAVGATLTGVGLTAAALDPATAVLTAGSAPGNAAAIQLSGLADPVAVSPVAAPVRSLAAAPSTAAGFLPNSVHGSAATVLHSVGTVAKGVTTRTVSVSTGSVVPSAGPSGSNSATEGYTGKHRSQTRSAAPPSDTTPLAAQSPSSSAPPASTAATPGTATPTQPTNTRPATGLPLVSDLLSGVGSGAPTGPLSGLLGADPLVGLLAGL